MQFFWRRQFFWQGAARRRPRRPGLHQPKAQLPGHRLPADTAAAVLDGFVCYGADTAGCSLKSAQAAAVLVEYLSRADISAETVTDWQGGWTAAAAGAACLELGRHPVQRPSVCEDPADGSGLLEAAGVTTDFGTIDLSAVPQRLDALDEVLRPSE